MVGLVLEIGIVLKKKCQFETILQYYSTTTRITWIIDSIVPVSSLASQLL